MFSDPLAFFAAHPGLLLLVVFAAAAIEYVFPPFWGDTLMLAGCAVAGMDRGTLLLVFGAALVGSIVGSMAAWWMGRRFGQASLKLLSRSDRARRLHARAERLYHVHGSRVLALNRFLPGARAFFLPLAGMGNMSGRRVLLWSTVGNVLYCALIACVGAFLASRAGSFAVLQSHFRTVMGIAAIVAVSVLLALGLRAALRARAARPA
jgi:membrane protein DedA with SNARE-associated domain